MNELEIEERAQKAQDLFKQGYNCSQAVFASCADIYGITDELKNYAFVQQLAGEFKGKYGSLICAELLGLAPRPQDPQPEARTPQYYEKRPCSEMVAEAVRIYLRSL